MSSRKAYQRAVRPAGRSSRRMPSGVSAVTMVSRISARSGRVRLAEEEVRGQHVQGLEFTADVTENPLQVLQHATGELVHQERATGLQDIAGFQQDLLTHGGGNGAEGNPGNDVAGI